MITSKRELIDCLEYERKLYIKGGILSGLKLLLLRDSEYLLWHYIKMLRYTEYYYNIGNKPLYFLYQRRKNIEGSRLGISIYHNSIDTGLRIYHYGSIIVNSHAKIGKNCQLHGENCVGNKGDAVMLEVPSIGDNVDIGVGAKVLGGIRIADNTVIGANAVVVKDSLKKGNTLLGIPAVEYRKHYNSSGVLL